MTLSEELLWRGFVQDTTLADISQLDQKDDLVLYVGFDATAPSQALGNLAALMAVKVFLRHGRQAIILAGGATSLIGDPGGKQEERPLLDQQDVESNVTAAIKQFKFIFRHEPGDVKYVNNLNWYGDFLLLDFLRDVGKKFPMTPLIQRDYIASRLGGDGISYAEFSYTLLQGYDYLRLYEDYGCNLQLGGSDQWGNCLSGVDLVRRQHGQSVDAITIPLIINKATGKKFGKSEGQTIFLDAEMTHPSDFYQFWLNVADEDALDYLKVFTSMTKPEIDSLKKECQQAPAERLAQKRLAEASCQLVHGDEALNLCRIFAKLAFSDASIPRTSAGLDELAEANKTQTEAQMLVIKDAGDLEGFLDETTRKVPGLESRAQIKQLASAGGLKIICSGDERPRQLILRDLAEFKRLAPAIPVLAVFGKNTIRGFSIAAR